MGLDMINWEIVVVSAIIGAVIAQLLINTTKD